MKEQKHFEIDVIHQFIKLDSNEQKLIQQDWFQKEIERTKSISHLGVIGEIFPLIKHSKWEHMLGVYFLAKKASLFDLLKGIGKKESFFLSSLMYSLGHCPLTLTTEEAVLIAVGLDEKVKNEVDEMVKHVLEYCPQCRECDEGCSDKISIEDRRSLYKWLTAYKTIKLKEKIDETLKGIKGISVIDIIRSLICKNYSGYKLLDKLDRIDFVLRDIYYSGIGKLDLNIDLLFASIKIGSLKGQIYQEWPPEHQMLQSLEEYLEERIYLSDEVVILSNLMTKTISLILIEGKLKVLELLEMDDSKLWEIINRYRESTGLIPKAQIKEKIESNKFRKVLELGIITENELKFIELEKEITSCEGTTVLRYPEQKGVLTHIKKEKLAYLFNYKIRLFNDDSFKLASPSLHAIVKTKNIALANIMDLVIPEAIHMTINEAVLKLLFISDVNVDYQKVTNSLQVFLEKSIKEDEIKDFVCKVLDNSIFKEVSTTFSSAPDSIQNIYDLAQEQSILSLKKIAEEIIEVPQFFNKNILKEINETLVRPHYNDKDINQSDAVELIAYLDFLSEEDNNVLESWTMPNVKLYEKGDIKREFDGLHIKLFKDGKVEIIIIECSKSDSEKKTIDDIVKNYNSRNELSLRFDDIDIGMYFYGKPLNVTFKEIK